MWPVHTHSRGSHGPHPKRHSALLAGFPFLRGGHKVPRAWRPPRATQQGALVAGTPTRGSVAPTPQPGLQRSCPARVWVWIWPLWIPEGPCGWEGEGSMAGPLWRWAGEPTALGGQGLGSSSAQCPRASFHCLLLPPLPSAPSTLNTTVSGPDSRGSLPTGFPASSCPF